MARPAQALQVRPRIRAAIGERQDVIDLLSSDHPAVREADAAARLLGSDLLTKRHTGASS